MRNPGGVMRRNRRGGRMRRQVDAVGAAGQRDIGARVDDHLGAAAERDGPLDQVAERAGGEILLADLDQVHAVASLRAMRASSGSTPPSDWRSVMWQRFVVALAGAGAAERAAVARTSRWKLMPSPHCGADDARPLEAGQVLRADLHAHPFGVEQLGVRHSR